MAPQEKQGSSSKKLHQRNVVGSGGKSGKYFTMSEVSKHNTDQDCWTVIHGKVYNLTDWIARHPGGTLIRQAYGRDASAIYESSHPNYVSDKILPKYYLGELDPNDYQEYVEWDTEFYRVLKDRVFGYFKERGISHHVSWLYTIKALFILTCFFTFMYLSFVKGHWWASVLLGVATAQLGIGIMHDGNHGAVSKNPFWNAVAAFAMDGMGASSYIWKHEHNIGHHQHTNTKEDPDANTGAPMLRMSPDSPHMWYHKYQHIYVFVLYAFVTTKWMFSDIVYFLKGTYRHIAMYPPSQQETILFWVTKATGISWALIMPVALHGWYGALMVLTTLVTSAECFALQFAVTHISDEAIFPHNDFPNVGERDWAKLQVMTSTNYSTKYWWTALYSGGLNFQIEHHLFPTICHTHYYEISPIVQQTCKEFGVPYKTYDTYLDALKGHLGLLKELGAGKSFHDFQEVQHRDNKKKQHVH